VTGERLRHELELILEERAPAMAIRRLAELGVLRRLEPGLDFDEWLGQKMEQAVQRSVLHPASGLAGSVLHPAGGAGEEPTEGSSAIRPVNVDQKYLLLAILTYRLTKTQLDRFLSRLRFSLEVGKYLREVHGLHALAWRLDRPNLRPSRIYQLLHGYSPRAILAFSVALDSSTARDNVLLYLDRLRWVRPATRGEFLKGQGVEPGPVYRQILDRLLYARLDGKIRTASEEEVMAKALLAGLSEPKSTT
jgi:tRNA nucleotidyltransferase (CCA-adding enzyme)